MTTPQSHVAVIDQGPALRFDGSAAPVLYLATAVSGAADGDSVWQITRYNTASGVQAYHPNGDDGYRYIWSLRATYTYS